jgi:homogentisate 1,2-dioxygenase
MAPATLAGFGNSFESEALPGALPRDQNNPQRAPYGLYTEQLSGTAFTAPRHVNRRVWLYRIRPGVRHAARFVSTDLPLWRSAPDETRLPLGQLRWGPVSLPAAPTTFAQGIRTMTVAGDVNLQMGMAAHIYVANTSMEDDYLLDADGEMLIVPQQGRLELRTELGRFEAGPGEIVLLPRGMMFQVRLVDGAARGYVCENYGAAFVLPERGPIGANGLAEARHFRAPVAAYEDRDTDSRIFVKWGGRFHVAESAHAPLDVVAWHGNLAPFVYDLRLFSPVGSVRVDHPDPSIFTVLTSPTPEAGTANVDFVIFPERWMVADHTFRPPWYHRNVMSEFMGLIEGRYDAKEKGFVPGGMSLHNMMLPHGPDAAGFEKASRAELAPQKLNDTLAFMFETRLPQHLTRFAGELDTLQGDYADCWADLRKRFDGTSGGDWSP